jgi:hypothetical protein
MGKTRYPLYRRLGRPQGRSERLRKISPVTGFHPRTVHPVASRYTDLDDLWYRLSYPSPAISVYISSSSLYCYRDILFNTLQAVNTGHPSLGDTVRCREGVNCTDRAMEDALQNVATAVERFTPSVQQCCSESADVAARRNGAFYSETRNVLKLRIYADTAHTSCPTPIPKVLIHFKPSGGSEPHPLIGSHWTGSTEIL